MGALLKRVESVVHLVDSEEETIVVLDPVLVSIELVGVHSVIFQVYGVVVVTLPIDVIVSIESRCRLNCPRLMVCVWIESVRYDHREDIECYQLVWNDTIV